MRRTGMMVAVVAVMVAMFATAAYAATIYGTSGNDTLNETADGIDRIYGYASNDYIDANNYGGDTDKLFGGGGGDELKADDGDVFDRIEGGRGYDVCYGDEGDTFVSCAESYITVRLP